MQFSVLHKWFRQCGYFYDLIYIVIPLPNKRFLHVYTTYFTKSRWNSLRSTSPVVNFLLLSVYETLSEKRVGALVMSFYVYNN